MYLPREAVRLTLEPVSLKSNGPRILGVTGFFTAFACTAVILRIYVRMVILNTIGRDDYAMAFAMVCSAAVFCLFVLEVHAGVGEHFNNPHLLSNLPDILRYTYHHGWIIVVGISSVKISIGFFLLRLCQGKWFKRFLIIWIVFLFIFTLACVGTFLTFSRVFQCIPVDAAWNFTVRLSPKTKCYDTRVFRSIGLFNGAANIFTDFLFATLPIPVILSLSLTARKKLALVFILSLGYFACAASIIKVYLLSTYFLNTDSFFNFSFNVWNSIELNTGILAASLPALRPLIATTLETASSLRSRTRIRMERRLEKREIRVIDQRKVHRNYRFYQPSVSSHDTKISLPLSLGHDTEIAMNGRRKMIGITNLSPLATPRRPEASYNVSDRGGKTGLSLEEENGIWRQDSRNSLGGSKLEILEGEEVFTRERTRPRREMGFRGR